MTKSHTPDISTAPTPLTRRPLTGRERFARMFERQDHDRVPRYDSFWADTITRWESEGLTGGYDGAMDLMGYYDIEGVGDSVPEVYHGQKKIVSEDEQTVVYQDPWGATVRYWKARSGTPEHVAWECDGRDAWESSIKPRLLASPPQPDLAWWKRRFEIHRAAQRYLVFGVQEAFEITRKLMGDVGSLYAMADDPELIQDISRTFADLVIRDMERFLANGIEADGLWIYGDMAYNHATICSPTMYRELIWPDHKRLADWAHAKGMKVLLHTDGDVRSFLDLYVEAGIDCLQPLEAKANMDLHSLVPSHGKRLAFFGNIDARVLSTNDRAMIEAEVRDKLRAGMAGRCYAYHSDHSVPPSVSLETYRFVVQLLDQYSYYG
ncbi:MAG: hypothetical protein IT444_00330 [Phycisphaeraceae bacterium]|nr:hypothetical protein [Phycisphaeraceae bacterium]